MQNNKKKLCKSSTDYKISGVCGGFAEYFGINSLWIRLALVLFSLWKPEIGIAIYIVCAFIMPD